MKIWKMVGCLGLLVVIICGCIILANPTTASAKEEEDTPKSEESQTQTKEEGLQAPTASNQTVTVEKTYSEGLRFRSNGDGTCALSGLGSCTAASVLIPPKSPSGDVVTEILSHALESSTLTAVEIPATVSVVSAAAFADCPRLSHIRVAAENASLLEYDGVLYTADGRTLLYCPEGRVPRELTLHKELRRIAAGAFAKCPALTTVYYAEGTAAWRNIIIGDDNDALYEAAFKFNAT